MTTPIRPAAFRATVLFAAALGLVAACETAPPTPLNMSDTVSVTATVEKLDIATRMLTLKAPDGKLMTVEVDPAVVNLPQLKVGDKVTASYTESYLAQIVSKGKMNGDPTVTVDADAAKIGAKPGGSLSAKTMVPVTISSVDAKNNMVSFYTADGVIRAITVQNPKAQAFIKQLKPGDNVDVTYSEALAVSVVPAQ